MNLQLQIEVFAIIKRALVVSKFKICICSRFVCKCKFQRVAYGYTSLFAIPIWYMSIGKFKESAIVCFS